MFDYIDTKIKNAQQLDTLKNHVDAYNLENLFTTEHYNKLASDVEKFKTNFTSTEYPADGSDPSIITFDKIRKQDKFYENLWQYVNPDNFKKLLLDKFNYNNPNFKKYKN